MHEIRFVVPYATYFTPIAVASIPNSNQVARAPCHGVLLKQVKYITSTVQYYPPCTTKQKTSFNNTT